MSPQISLFAARSSRGLMRLGEQMMHIFLALWCRLVVAIVLGGSGPSGVNLLFRTDFNGLKVIIISQCRC